MPSSARPGLPHAIGAGILLVELQEPSDFSVLLEWDGFPLGPADATLGLSFDEALACVDRRACTPPRLSALRGGSGDALLPAAAEGFFSADHVVAGDLPPGFGVLIVTAGSGLLSGSWGSLPVAGGQTIVVPFAAGPARLGGTAVGIYCRPAATP